MLTKRQRIAGWIGLDAERRRRQDIVAQVTARLAEKRPPPAADITWPPPGGTFSQRRGFTKLKFGDPALEGPGNPLDFGVITTHTAP